MARIRDTAPANGRGFVIFEARHAMMPKGKRRVAVRHFIPAVLRQPHINYQLYAKRRDVIEVLTKCRV